VKRTVRTAHKHVFVAGVLVTTLMTVGCGESSDEADQASSKPANSAKPHREKKTKPVDQVLVCLQRSGASDAEKRDRDLWRGGGLIVHLYKSAGEAERNTEGVDVAIEAAGRYTVVAPFQTDRDARNAVATTADCLKNG